MRTGESKETSASSVPNWHAIFTRHQHEKAVASALSCKGHEVYLPLYVSARRWQDRIKRLSLPLFPGYVFVREGLDRQFQIVTTPGVISVVGWGGRPAIVPQDQLNAVRRIVEGRYPVEACRYLECGDRVRVKAGPLAGVEGILTRKKGLTRLVVSMDLLGRSAAVEIDHSNVEPIGRREFPITSGGVCAFA
jgi:transcription antitermination factor NusG